MSPAPTGTLAVRAETPVPLVEIMQSLNPPGTEVSRRNGLRWRASAARKHLPDAPLTLSETPWARDHVPVPVRPASDVWTPAAIERYAALRSAHRRAPYFQGDPGRLFPTLTLGVAAIATGAVGLYDFLFGADVGTRVIAALLLAAAVLMATAGRLLYSRWRGRFVLAFIAALALCLTGGGIFAAFVSAGGGYPAVFLVALILIVLGSVIAALFWSRGGRPVVRFLLTGAPGFVTSVLTLGTIAGLAQFWYQSVYVPSRTDPVINILTTVERLPGRAFETQVTLRNPTSDEIMVIGSHFDVVAYRATPSRAGRVEGEPNGGASDARDVPLGRHAPLEREGVLRSGEVVAPGVVLAPSGEVSRRIAVVPHERDRAAVVRVMLATMRRRLDQQDLRPEPRRIDQAEGVVYREFDIVENGAWRWLTRGDRVIYTIEALEDGGTGRPCAGLDQIQAYVARPGTQTDVAARDFPACSSTELMFDSFYGVSTEEAVTEIALGASAGRASRSTN